MLAILALAATPLFGQTDPKIGYEGWQTGVQTRNIPAGTVNDPGSHLTWIIDTGVNARSLLGDVSLASASSVPIVDLADWLDTDGDEVLDSGAINQNFISITNSHPTAAVTVHFRYYNDNCDDVVDFLVLLTCNDTLMFDPLNFEIPGSNGENTFDRFFRVTRRPGKVLTPISTAAYGSGRFVITAAASGAEISGSNWADILFPFELGRALSGECNIWFGDRDDDGVAQLPNDALSQLQNNTIEQTLIGNLTGQKWVNVGVNPGITQNNLHVFNAFQISFNYLHGSRTEAKPAAGVFQANGNTAWARPAVDLGGPNSSMPGFQMNDGNWNFIGRPDGDATHAPTGCIALGGELGVNSTGATIGPNGVYLRNEVHGGDTRWVSGNASNGGFSLYGALGTSSLWPVPDPNNIIQHFLSVTDDYNGSNNAASFGTSDRSSNISPAATTYLLQIYDNNEDILDLPEDTPLNVSPPLPGETIDLRLTCFCLRAFVTSVISPQTNVDDVTVQELDDIFDGRVLNGIADFDGLLAPVPPDLAGGWIRYVRDNTLTVDSLPDCIQTSGGSCILNRAQWVGFTIAAPAHGPGTSTFDAEGFADVVSGYYPSFMTIANQIQRDSGFGVEWWKFAVASDPRVSDTGDVTP